MNRSDVVAAAKRADLIVHGGQSARLSELARSGVAHAAKTPSPPPRPSGARIFFPGTVYNFGPDTFPLVAEDAPQHPRTRKGSIRVEMEACLRQAADQGVKTLILRAGDFFGPETTGNSWFGAAVVQARPPIEVRGLSRAVPTSATPGPICPMSRKPPPD